MDFNEIIKRGRRVLDGNFSSRKTILITLTVLALLLYLLPQIFRILTFRTQQTLNDFSSETLSQRLAAFYFMEREIDGHIIHKPLIEGEKPFVPYIGNGYIAMGIDGDSPIHIKNSRSLALPVLYRPIVLLSLQGWEVNEAIVTHYRNGIVSRLQHWQSDSNNIDVTYQVYVHRLTPSLLIQDITVSNPTDLDLIFDVEQIGLRDWPIASFRTEKLGEDGSEYLVISGTIDMLSSPGMVVPISIVSRKMPTTLDVKAKTTKSLHIVSSVNYSGPIQASTYKDVKKGIETTALASVVEAIKSEAKELKYRHSQVWQQLWQPGFSISHSKAEKAVNGDLINATVYYVLSQSSAPLHEIETPAEKRSEILKDLSYAEGCYGGHNTLNAERLWSMALSSVDEVNEIVALWIMTLEKQGCHQLLRTGADGVMEAMLLSFGGLQFKNQHFEFNVDPKHLHRDYHFRRLSYGNATHLNISVMVQEDDYKAVIYVALDRSDRNYYGCDAGCLDPPAQLGQIPISFPVKLTDPLTAILYITSDKVHMEELKHTIHVKEIALAPAHEHHVIALHKHGHKWGGLPTLFWMTIIALIVIFHLFLFKLVVNEYCGTDVKVRYRKWMEV